MGRAWQVTQRMVTGFFGDGCPKLAAAISYYALFALIPLAILGVAVLGLVFGDDRVRAELIQGVLDALPLRPEKGRVELEGLLNEVTEGAGSAGVLALAILAVTASGVMGAVRFALNQILHVPDERPPITGKLLDVAAILGVGLVLAASLGATVVARELGINRILLGEVVPVLLAFAVYLSLLRGVPAVALPLRALWPGALLGAVGYGVLKLGFLTYLNNSSSVYLSLGVIAAVLLFLFLSANAFLLGAELGYAIHLARCGALEDDEDLDEPFSVRLRRALRGTVLRTPPPAAGSRPGASAEPG